ncbi:MAG: putative metal-binding motif-containing protein [Myxococcales bacterium]|nr:putative metal-binding motif-containing protein [Myxococcales bacterium]
MRRRAAVAAALLSSLVAWSGCFKAWDVGGPWACSADETCPSGLTCDDGVCCQPGGAPSCPTLPVEGRCPSGEAPQAFFRDRDGDGAGDPSTTRLFCSAPVKEKWVTAGDDCNDTDVAIGPRATERCNAVDDDCDGEVDDGTTRSTWYVDVDGDSFGDDCGASCRLLACAQPLGYAARAGDCAPADALRFPGAVEHCNDVDDNCNGLPDDPPYGDVENPGADGGARFDCVTGRPGACAPGGLQCVFDVGAGRFQPTCVPRRAPEPDVCGDGVDSDCSGAADDRPGCGGPAIFINAPGTAVRAVAVPFTGFPTTGSRLPARCIGDEPGASEMSWLNPAWIATTGVRQVWLIEAPAGFPWDLSQASAAVSVRFVTRQYVGHSEDGGLWGDATWFRGPVVNVCGEQPGEMHRLVPEVGTALAASTTSFAATVPLWGAHPGWTEESGTVVLNRRRVTRLEVVVSPRPTDTGADLVTFTTEWLGDAGMR